VKDATVTIDMGKRCAECGKPGATGSGICLACAHKVIVGGAMKSRQGRAAQMRFQAIRDTLMPKAGGGQT